MDEPERMDEPVIPDEVPAEDVSGVSAEGLQGLPRWARVAFAVRCGRRVQRLLRQDWPGVHSDDQDTFERALAVAEQSCAEAGPAPGLEDAIDDLNAPAVADLTSMRAAGTDPGHASLAEAARYAFFRAASAAVRCAAAAAAADDDACTGAAFAAYQAVDTVRHVPGVDRAESDLLADFETLRQATGGGQWKDDTPVRPEVFKTSG